MIKEMMKRLQRGERNPHRWINFGGVFFQWKEKEKIQRMTDLATSYIAQLEEHNKVLVEKNNDLIQKLSPVAETKPEQPTEGNSPLSTTETTIQPQAETQGC